MSAPELPGAPVGTTARRGERGDVLLADDANDTFTSAGRTQATAELIAGR
jgi:hypothetical protein